MRSRPAPVLRPLVPDTFSLHQSTQNKKYYTIYRVDPLSGRG